MESSRHTSSSRDESSRSNRRHRNRKSKSSVSDRLNPNFDPKTSSRSDLSKNNDELDPKTMNFEELVNLLHPSFVSDHLQKILHFLQSEKQELRFPNIAPFKEAFLLKIADRNEHLRCIKFNEISRVVAKQILEVSEAKKNVYSWKYIYEGGRNSDEVLVYRKIYNNRSQISSQMSSQRNYNDVDMPGTPSPPPPQYHDFKIPGTPSPPPPSVSLAYSMEDLRLNSSRQDHVPAAFKTKALNTTLKFIRDDTLLMLRYPEMSIPETNFIYSLISNRNSASDTCFGFKSLSATLHDAMKMCEHKFEYKISFIATNNVETSRIALEKVPKNSIPNKSDTSTLSRPDLSVASPPITKGMRDFNIKRRLLAEVPEAFKMKTLKQLLDFISDSTRARMEFRNVTIIESRFLETSTSLARRPEYHQLVSEEVLVLLKSIAKSYARETWKIQMNVGKLDKWTKQKTVVIFKAPIDSKHGLNSSTVSDIPSKPRVDSKNTSSSSESSRRRVNSKDRSVTERLKEDTRVRNPESAIRTRSKDRNAPERQDYRPETSRVRPRSRDRRGHQPKSIAFESAGAQVIDPTHVTPKSEAVQFAAPNARKSKLFEAMSTPLESDVAERMMRLMGWEGGALGARGEGIKEPIMPALHLAPGAGLGHVRTTMPQQQRSAPEFRRHFLQSLLTLLQTDARDTTLPYPATLTKRERRFIKAAVNAFNDRKSIGLGRDQEMRLVKRIGEELEHTNLVVNHSLSNDMKEVYLQKSSAAGVISKRDRKRARTAAAKQAVNNTKAERGLACRLMFLERIRDFLDTDSTESAFSFDIILNTRHRSFIQGVLTSANKREKRQYSSDAENDIYYDINRAAKDCFLSAAFEDYTMILNKKVYQKRFTNSSMGLPLPKSNNVKNTVIDNNGVASNRSNDVTEGGLGSRNKVSQSSNRYNEHDDRVNDRHNASQSSHNKYDDVTEGGLGSDRNKSQSSNRYNEHDDRVNDRHNASHKRFNNDVTEGGLGSSNRVSQSSDRYNDDDKVSNDRNNRHNDDRSDTGGLGNNRNRVSQSSNRYNEHDDRVSNDRNNRPNEGRNDDRSDTGGLGSSRNRVSQSSNRYNEHDDRVSNDRNNRPNEGRNDDDKAISSRASHNRFVSVYNHEDRTAMENRMNISNSNRASQSNHDRHDRNDDEIEHNRIAQNSHIRYKNDDDKAVPDIISSIGKYNDNSRNRSGYNDDGNVNNTDHDEYNENDDSDFMSINGSINPDCDAMYIDGELIHDDIQSNHDETDQDDDVNSADKLDDDHDELNKDEADIVAEANNIDGTDNANDEACDDNGIIAENVEKNDSDVHDLNENTETSIIPTDFTDSSDSMTNKHTNCTDSVLETTDLVKERSEIAITSDNDDDSNYYDDTSSYIDVSLNLSNESLLLDLVEAQNGGDVKADNMSVDSQFEKDVNDIEKDILNSDIQTLADVKTEKDEIEDNAVKIETNVNSSPNQESEINNNCNNESTNKTSLVDNSDNVDELQDVKTESEKDLSPSSGKRSRSDSENSGKITRKFKRTETVHSIRIIPRNPADRISVDAVKKLQILISEQIDSSFSLLPSLQCHGIKNGGLVYSCHNEESLDWLNNIVSVAKDLDLKTTETELYDEQNHKLRMKIRCLDNVEKIMYRLELYNVGLQTVFWKVLDVQTNRDYVIITVVIDDESYKYVCKEKFSLFAGVDKASFSVVWD